MWVRVWASNQIRCRSQPSPCICSHTHRPRQTIARTNLGLAVTIENIVLVRQKYGIGKREGNDVRILRRQTMYKSRFAIVFGTSLSLLAFSGCKDNPLAERPDTASRSELFDYKNSNLSDDFSSLKRSSSSASFEKKKSIVVVDITCNRNTKNSDKNDLKLEVKIYRKDNNEEVNDYSTVLYKIDDQDPKIYRDEFLNSGTIYDNININLYGILGDSGQNIPKLLKIRILWGVSPLQSQLGDIDAIANNPKIDLEIPVRTSNISKVISDCKRNPASGI